MRRLCPPGSENTEGNFKLAHLLMHLCLLTYLVTQFKTTGMPTYDNEVLISLHFVLICTPRRGYICLQRCVRECGKSLGKVGWRARNWA
jgi:hypothetical protein